MNPLPSCYDLSIALAAEAAQRPYSKVIEKVNETINSELQYQFREPRTPEGVLYLTLNTASWSKAHRAAIKNDLIDAGYNVSCISDCFWTWQVQANIVCQTANALPYVLDQRIIPARELCRVYKRDQFIESLPTLLHFYASHGLDFCITDCNEIDQEYIIALLRDKGYVVKDGIVLLGHLRREEDMFTATDMPPCC